MKKILLVNDAYSVSPGAVAFASYVARVGKARVTGLFIDHHSVAEVPRVVHAGGQLYVEEITENVQERRVKRQQVQQTIDHFHNACAKEEVCGNTRILSGDALQAIVVETRYADLVVVDAGLSISGDKKVPSVFLEHLLHSAECPVIVVPEHFEAVDEIVLAYDESKSSMFAIKQFYYHMPALVDKKVTVLHFDDDKGNGNEHTRELFREWLETNFIDVSFVDVRGTPRDGLFKYFMQQDDVHNKMLVLGSFGRSFLSGLFWPATSGLVLKAVNVPVFVSHG